MFSRRYSSSSSAGVEAQQLEAGDDLDRRSPRVPAQSAAAIFLYALLDALLDALWEGRMDGINAWGMQLLPRPRTFNRARGC